MPQVTKIEQQKKRTGRYSIHVDGKYAFSLSDNDLVATGVYPSQELSQQDLADLQKLSLESKAIDRVYNYLSFRRRSEREVRDYLNKRGHEEDFIVETLGRLRKQGLVSDQQFAASWVSDRQTLKPRSRRHLQQELRQKGIDPELIEQAVAEISDEDEIANIQKLATKKLVQTKFQDQQKLITYLVGQGYSYDLVKRALESLEDV